MRTLSYALPGYLPQVEAPLVNPTVHLFERKLSAERERDCARRRWQAPWKLETHAGAVARLEVPTDGSEQLRVEIEHTDQALPWHVTLIKSSFELVAGRRYRLEFRTRADSPRTLAVAVGRNELPWDALGLYQDVSVGTTWTGVQLDFTAEATTSNARLYFPAASHRAAIEFAEVRLIDLAVGKDLVFDVADR